MAPQFYPLQPITHGKIKRERYIQNKIKIRQTQNKTPTPKILWDLCTYVDQNKTKLIFFKPTCDLCTYVN